MDNLFDVQQNIEDYVENYSSRILNDPDFYEKDEGYKYQAVSTFQKEFNINAKDLKSMLERSLKDALNLVESGNYFPKNALLRYAELHPEFVRKELRNLLYGKDSIAKRINDFIESIKNKFQEERFYIDHRFLSFFLAAHKPDKYFYVKSSEYQEFAKMMGYNLTLKGSQGDRYEELSRLAEITKDVLKENDKFLQVHELIVKDFDYKDKSLGWGTYDFIFNVSRREKWKGLSEEIDKIREEREKFKEWKKEQYRDFIENKKLESQVSKIKSKKDLLEEGKKFKPSSENYVRIQGTNKRRRESLKQKIIVKQYNDYKCQVCGFSLEYVTKKGQKRKYIEVDHIIDKFKGGSEELSNLWVLCPNCHAKKTLGVIKIDSETKKVTENGKVIKINLGHLKEFGWK